MIPFPGNLHPANNLLVFAPVWIPNLHCCRIIEGSQQVPAKLSGFTQEHQQHRIYGNSCKLKRPLKLQRRCLGFCKQEKYCNNMEPQTQRLQEQETLWGQGTVPYSALGNCCQGKSRSHGIEGPQFCKAQGKEQRRLIPEEVRTSVEEERTSRAVAMGP